MILPCSRFPHLVAGAAAAGFLIFGAFGHSGWPQTATPIKIVVPYPPGGPADFAARLLAEQISRTHGQQMVVENRPGAGSAIGTEAVSRAAPDGHTLLVTANAFVTNPHFRKLNYDPLSSFEPICDLTSTPLLIVVNSASPYHTLADLLAATRAKPGALTLAGIPATISHIAFEMLRRAAKVDMTFVPYPGDAPMVSALLGDHVMSASLSYPSVVEQLRADKVRALATLSRTRIEPLSNVPTVAEAGYQDIGGTDLWIGLLAPAKTPKEKVSQLSSWFTTAMQVPEVRAQLVAQGNFPVGLCGGDFATLLRKQYEKYGRVIDEANIKAE